MKPTEKQKLGSEILKKMAAIMLAGIFLWLAVPGIGMAVVDNYNYNLLEPIPGFETTGGPGPNQFEQYVLAIYKFGVWTVGIAAMFMLIFGGFMYVTSAGNTSRVGTARTVITSALVGLVAAFTAYLLLYVINPDLVKVNLDKITTEGNRTVIGTGFESKPMGWDLPLSEGGLGGDCEPVTTAGSPCLTSNLNASFGVNAPKASAICKVESGGKSSALSRTDLCRGGKSFSIGLFQINLVVNGGMIPGGGCSKNDVFTVVGRNQGNIVERNGNVTTYDCTVKDINRYNDCVRKLQDPATNIAIAKTLSNSGASWRLWGANRICKY